jgi:hypothetical protein
MAQNPAVQEAHTPPSASKVSAYGILDACKYFLLPALAAIYPSVFYYGHNIHDLLLVNLGRTLSIYFLLTVIFFNISFFFNHGALLKAANATFVFLIFFNAYGILEKYFVQLDWFPVRSFTFLPVVLLIAFYSTWLIVKLKDSLAKQLWNASVIIVAGLILYNLTIIVPAEILKYRRSNSAISATPQTIPGLQKNKPDIYYIILDEFAGFKSMGEYWEYSDIDKFKEFLILHNFVVYEDSKAGANSTLHQLFTRLNYQETPYELTQENMDIWFEGIADNRVMKFMKDQGYSTITFNEMSYAYSSAQEMRNVDYSFDYKDVPATDLGIFFDNFGILVADNTMINVFSKYYKRSGSNQHSNMIFYTARKIGDLREIPSPKFIYVHLIFPHLPYMFDQDGNVNLPEVYTNYDYYLGNYKFAVKVAMEMVDNILSEYSPTQQPVIILQSDHGFRNLKDRNTDVLPLPDYPREFGLNILYARLLPGYEPSYSAQEMDPINTFPIVFNYLFDANIPLK